MRLDVSGAGFSIAAATPEEVVAAEVLFLVLRNAQHEYVFEEK